MGMILSTGCACLKDYPDDHLYEVDLTHSVCGEYKVVDKKNLKFEYVKDNPMSECEGVIGYKGPAFEEVRRVLLKAEKCYENGCQK